jgi:hypothetical protein
MAIQLHSNFFPPRTFLTLDRAVNFLRDNKAKMARSLSMSTEDGPGPFPSLKFWFVNDNQAGNREVVDPTNPARRIYVHGEE